MTCIPFLLQVIVTHYPKYDDDDWYYNNNSAWAGGLVIFLILLFCIASFVIWIPPAPVYTRCRQCGAQLAANELCEPCALVQS